MKASIDYFDLEDRLSLQKRPYITIANTLKQIYSKLLKTTQLTEKKITAFDFVVFETQTASSPHYQQFFRWLPVYNQTKIKRILEKKDFFKNTAHLVHQRICNRTRLDDEYLNILQEADSFNEVEFLTAVLQLTYGFPIPIMFNYGIVHQEHQIKNSALIHSAEAKQSPFFYYDADLGIDEPFDLANLPPLRIKNSAFKYQNQVNKQLYSREYEKFSYFYQSWCSRLLDLPLNTTSLKDYKFVHHTYFPVYDGLFPQEGVLRGYLVVFCSDEQAREKAFPFLKQHFHIIQHSINEAFQEGTQSSLVDNYTNLQTDPVIYWSEHLSRIQKWSSIKLEFNNDTIEKVFKFDFPYCKISIERLIQRSSVADYVKPELLTAHRNKILSLELPRSSLETIGLKNLNSDSPYLEKRVKDAIHFLDELLRKHHILKSEEKIKAAARRAAVAAIMSRNMSHNLGSHVIPRTKLQRIRERLKLPVTSSHLAFEVVGLLKDRLDSYIQKKADFLAEITSEPLATTKSMLFYRELLLPFIENVLLMDNLAANEGFNYQENNQRCPLHNRLFIRVFINGHELKTHYSYNNGKDVYVYPNALPYSLYSLENFLLPEIKIENGEHDIEVELPGPLGEYAFYSILENLIRNVAKHHPRTNSMNPDKALVITIHLSDKKEKDLYQVEISDNLSYPKQRCGEIPLSEYLNNCISESLINEIDGSLIRKSWGISEMKICAALLAGSVDFTRMNRYLRVQDQAAEQRFSLIYRFGLMKPRKVCLIAENAQTHARNLTGNGFQYFNTSEELKQFLMTNPNGATFKFVVIDASSSKVRESLEVLPALASALPFRVLITGAEVQTLPRNVQQLIQHRRIWLVEEKLALDQPAEELMRWIWEQWVKRWIGNQQVAISIFLEQNCGEAPTLCWKTCASIFNSIDSCVSLHVLGKGGYCMPTRETQQQLHLFYDRHAGAVRHTDFSKNFLGPHTYNLLDKKSADFISLFCPKFPTEKDCKNWYYPFQLAEASLLRVLIIDERLTEFSAGILEDVNLAYIHDYIGAPPQAPTLWHLAWAANVHICTHLGLENLSPLHPVIPQNSEYFLKVQIDPSACSSGKPMLNYSWKMTGTKGTDLAIDLLIIHQSILDCLPIEHERFLTHLQTQIPFLVVDSGRGIPHTLSTQVKFLPFSLLQHFVTGERIAKLNLAQILMALSRQKGGFA